MYNPRSRSHKYAEGIEYVWQAMLHLSGSLQLRESVRSRCTVTLQGHLAHRIIRCKTAPPTGPPMLMACPQGNQGRADLQASLQGNIKCQAQGPRPLATFPLKPQEGYQAIWLGGSDPRACPLISGFPPLGHCLTPRSLLNDQVSKCCALQSFQTSLACQEIVHMSQGCSLPLCADLSVLM